MLDARRGRAVPHDRNQHDNGSEIDLWAEEPQRRRRRPRSAAIDGAAEAEPPIVLGAELAAPTARLALVARRMQHAAAQPASPGPRDLGEIGVEGEQQMMECGIGQQLSIQRMRPPRFDGADPMAKPGRNDPCPCGSGNKYKKCCQPKDEAAERDGLAAAQARREERAAEQRQRDHELHTEVAAWLRQAEEEDLLDDALEDASNAVIDLVKAGKLDEAEAASRALLARYPQAHDGWDRLGMVHEARGNSREAADCYRRVLHFLRDHPDYTDDDGLATLYTGLIAKLEPPAAT